MGSCLVPYYYRQQTKLREGNVFRGVCLSTGGSLSRGLCPGGLCPGRSLSGVVSVEGISVEGISVEGVSVEGGLCPGGLGSLSGPQEVTHAQTVQSLLQHYSTAVHPLLIFRKISCTGLQSWPHPLCTGPPTPSDIFKLVQLGPHFTRSQPCPYQHVQTYSSLYRPPPPP